MNQTYHACLSIAMQIRGIYTVIAFKMFSQNKPLDREKSRAETYECLLVDMQYKKAVKKCNICSSVYGKKNNKKLSFNRLKTISNYSKITLNVSHKITSGAIQ